MVLQHVLTASSSCIGNGCPGSGGSGTSYTVDYVLGPLVLLWAVGLLVAGRFTDLRQRGRGPHERAASGGVAFMSALGVLGILVGLVILVGRPIH